MTETIGKDELARMFAGAADRIRNEHERLSELDSIGGDGDHGSTMLRCVEQLEKAAVPGADNCAAIFRDAGWAVLSVDGGASSSLLGMFFSGMADAPCQAPSLDCRALSDAFAAGLRAAARHTQAKPGDKTMMDALVPAVEALRTAAASGRCVTDALREASAAARAGAESTRELTARYGRAKYRGEKTRGHLDPGATSIALLFEGFYQGLAASRGESGNA
jgi:phosphoenolpyruvate---glycerone phosphotransferase subunit DhaL